MKHVFSLGIFVSLIFISVHGFSQLNLRFEENETPQWHEVIAMYEQLDEKYSNARLIEAGTSDAGKPLHLFIITEDAEFTPAEVHASNKRIILINNGIHPGESNGIDASLAFASELLKGENRSTKYLKNTVILIVPVFNIGGALNRSPYNRANQNGPKEHGFRGNARNLDLNRDFVKMDSRNAQSLAKIIQEWDPDIFIDTHSTNGADYPYTVTLISSHPQQMEQPQSDLLQKSLEPFLYEKMNASPYKMSHYVNVYRASPEDGFEGFYEYPRYLAGYTSIFHILSFTVETHMLKPYGERVRSTKYLLEEFLNFTGNNSKNLKSAKEQAIEASQNKKNHVLLWKNDTSKYDLISFTGYRAKTRESQLTGLPMTFYDQTEKWTKNIHFYNSFTPRIEVKAPDYYVVPGAWGEVIERLKISNIKMEALKKDSTLQVEAYYIEDFQSSSMPYNGHYWHYSTSVRSEMITVNLQKGDYIIPVQQRGGAFLVHTLEPQAYDSFFSWNFFDACLSRNEYFSPYLFEKTAIQVLENDPDLKSEFYTKRKDDPDFAKNHYAQLNWIYERSPWSEPSYRRYPVFRIDGGSN